MSEKIHIQLRCPVCDRTGTAVVREASDHAYMRGDLDVSVYQMPDGFKGATRATNAFNGNFDVDCVEHNVSAIGQTK